MQHMSLQSKTIFLVIAMFLGALSVVAVSAYLIVLQGFTRLETEQMRTHLERTTAAVHSMLSDLDRTLNDWASWDETYTFILKKNPDYIRANLTDETLGNLQLDFMLFLNLDGKLVYAKGLRSDLPQETVLLQELIRKVTKHPQLYRFQSDQSRLAGLLQLPSGTAFLASQPIVHNNGSGPIAGALLIGRYADEDEVNHLERFVRYPLTAHRFSDIGVHHALRPVHDRLQGIEREWIEAESAQRLSGYIRIDDLNGAPAMLMQVSVRRSVMAQGMLTIKYLLLILAGIDVLFCSLLVWWMKGLVLTRLVSLSQAVKRVEAGSESPARVTIPSRTHAPDELDDLVTAINTMLSALDDAYHDLLQQAALREREERYRALSSALTLAEDAERRRIAADLHDHIGQTLVATRLMLGTLKDRLHDDDVAESLEQIRVLLEQGIEWTRSLTVDISPPILYERGFVEAVHWLAGRMRDHYHLEVSVQVEGAAQELKTEMSSLLFRAVRELLMNTVKHAQAAEATITIRWTDSELAIFVEDRGTGFDLSELRERQEEHSGYGLFSIRERLHYLNGDFFLESCPGQGTRGTLTLPLRQRRESALRA